MNQRIKIKIEGSGTKEELKSDIIALLVLMDKLTHEEIAKGFNAMGTNTDSSITEDETQ